MKYGIQYFSIQMYGFIFVAMTFTVTSALRGIGDTRMPLIYNTTANVVNVFFNYCLIYGKLGFPKLGVAGASIATVIGQTVAFVIALVVVMSKKRYIYFSFKEKFTFDKAIMSSVVTIGLPAMIEQLIMRAGAIVYQRTVAGLGDTLFATHQVCVSIQAITFMMGQAFANSATTLTGQSLGKRRIDMATNYIKETRKLGLIISVALGALLFLFNDQLIALYNDTPEVVTMGAKVLIFVAIMIPFQADQFIVAGGMRGAGDTKFAAYVTLVTVIGARMGLGLLCVKVLKWGLTGAWVALIADQGLRTVLIWIRYKSGKWKRIRISGDSDAPAKAN